MGAEGGGGDWGGGGREGGREYGGVCGETVDYIYIHLSLHCNHQNASCIKPDGQR